MLDPCQPLQPTPVFKPVPVDLEQGASNIIPIIQVGTCMLSIYVRMYSTNTAFSIEVVHAFFAHARPVPVASGYAA